MKWAWVTFDVCLAPAMLRLSRRHGQALSLVLAALVTCDAALTLAQALLFNLPRARGAFELAVVGVAVAAPAVAAVLLWSARMHRPERLVGA
ncbi:hypothetical protein AB3662_29530 [Sorangium cellulosum]|uniref:hypothetical protein n=1 Tax=Sorangium cellulosum TaxID=56 RepID=UPI003D9A1836